MDFYLKIDGDVESRTDVDFHTESVVEVFVQLLCEIVGEVSEKDILSTGSEWKYERGGVIYTFEES